jgi:heat-inducible transcriptional repressor
MVIRQYVRDVHPVSSQSLADDMRVSPATVRNELAALEEQGYLHQPHTSGGRIPTDLAYRTFVEELIEHLSDTMTQRARVAGVYAQLSRETEALLESTVGLLTEATGYVAWVSMPIPAALDVRSLSFVELDAGKVLLVLVTGAGEMHSRVAPTGMAAKELELGRLTDALNHYLRGRSMLSIDYDEIRGIFQEVVRVPGSLLMAVEEFFMSLAGANERVVFGNALQLVLQPEFSRVENLAGVMNALQDRERFITTLRRQLGDRQVETIIGSENLDPALQQCSLVFSRYAVPGGADGTLGVLGPTRLLYERTLKWVKVVGEAVAETLTSMALGPSGEGEEDQQGE